MSVQARVINLCSACDDDALLGPTLFLVVTAGIVMATDMNDSCVATMGVTNVVIFAVVAGVYNL